MAETYQRICIEDYAVEGIGYDDKPDVAKVERGKEYITSPERDGKVTVYTRYWFKVPVTCFAGERRFT